MSDSALPQGLKPYPGYKDSGVSWLGEVPKHWPVLPNRALFTEVKDRNCPDEQMLSVTISKGVIRQADLLSNSSKKDSSNENKTAYKLVRPGDIAYNKMRAWQGAVGVSEHIGIVSPAYIVVRPRNEQNSRYFHYLLRTPAFAKEAERWSYGITSDQWSLRHEDFKRIYCSVPPKDEQTSIVRFLDNTDRLIRRYIHDKKKLIGLLNEQKQGIIHQTVTRGLDPDVRLKPSNVEWLGDVPEHWKVTTLRRLVLHVTSGSRGWAEFYRDEGDLFLQSGNLGRNMALNMSFVQRVQPPLGSEGVRTKVQRDDLLICITGALTGNVVLVDVDLPTAYVNQHVALVRPKKNQVLPRFIAYCLHSRIGQSQFKTTEYGGTKQGLGLDDVKNVWVPIPTYSEQENLVKALDLQLSNLNEAVRRIQHEIDLIREYRTRLITDVVTGKLDVRGVAVEAVEEELDELLDVDDADLEEADEGVGEEGEADA